MVAPSLSVILPTHRLRDRVDVTVRSLVAQTLDPAAFECVFADDASDDGTADAIAAWQGRVPFRIALLRGDTNLGRSENRNRACRTARGDVLVFLDGDMVADPGLLAAYAARFGAGNVDVVSGRRRHLDIRSVRVPLLEHVAGLAGRGPDELFADGHALGDLFARCPLGQVPQRCQELLETTMDELCCRFPTSLARAYALITSNCAVSRRAFEDAGGFYPSLARCEDTDLGLTLAERGARFAYASEACALHPFTGFGVDADPRTTLSVLLARHPYMVVALAQLHAHAVESGGPLPDPVLSSLLAIARAEVDGTLARVDVRRIQETLDDRALPLDGLWLERGAAIRLIAARHHVDTPRAEALVDEATRSHVLQAPAADGPALELLHLTNWLDTCTPLRQHGHEHSFLRRHPTPRMAGDDGAPPRTVTWCGRYELAIHAAGDAQIVNLGLPVTTAAQSDVAIDEWTPPELAAYRRDGMVIGFPVERRDEIRIGYRFSCRVTEWTGGLDVDRAGQYDAPTFASSAVPDLISTVRRLGLDNTSSAHDRALAVYRWLLDHMRYCVIGVASHRLLATGIGSCIQLARLFVNLCRIAGVPARERTGLTFAVATGERGAVWAGHVTPFAHTWAEFRCPDRGWVPVETFPLHHGQRALTPANFPDPALRREFIDDGARLDRYYFGTIDPYRIAGAPHALRIPTLATWRDGRWRGVMAGVDALHTISAEMGVDR